MVELQGQGLTNENHKQEIQNLERQLEHAIMEKNKLQVDFNLSFFPFFFFSVIVD